MAKAKDKFGNGMVYEQFGDVYKPETEQVKKQSETKTKYSETCLACNKKLEYKGTGRRKMFCDNNCKLKYYAKGRTEQYNELQAVCPTCKNSSFQKDGFNFKGIQKFACKNCGRKFQGKYRRRANQTMSINPTCIHCGERYMIWKHGNEDFKDFKENREVLTEKDRRDRNAKYFRLLSNPLCYKCMKHTQKLSFTKKGFRIYFCPRCKIRFVKTSERRIVK